MPSSVFDRLASQGTASSRVREAEEIASRTKQEQRRAANAKATTPKRNTIKEQALKPPQDQKVKSPKRTQQQQNDFLNRLSKQETASSAAHHTIDRSRSHISPKKSTPKPKKKLTPSEKSAVFNRLYKQETSATKAHHHVKEEKVSTTATTSPMKKKFTPPPSLLKRIEDEKKAEKSGGSSTLTPIQMKLHIRTKDDKKENKPYSNLEMPEGEVRRQINLFHSKKISAHALAYDIINVLFDRKFVLPTGGAQPWDVGTAILEELDCITDKTILTIEEDKDDIVCYSACKEAVHTKEDMKFVKAKCTIKISSENVYVDDYSYDVTK